MSPRHPAATEPYAELSSPSLMSADCRAAERRLSGIAQAALRPSPSLRYADYPREVAKPEISVDRAAARLAAALHLHLD